MVVVGDNMLGVVVAAVEEKDEAQLLGFQNRRNDWEWIEAAI